MKAMPELFSTHLILFRKRGTEDPWDIWDTGWNDPHSANVMLVILSEEYHEYAFRLVRVIELEQVADPDDYNPAPPKKEYLVPQTPTDGVAAVFGQWPGDETEKKLLAMVKRQRGKPLIDWTPEQYAEFDGPTLTRIAREIERQKEHLDAQKLAVYHEINKREKVEG